MPNELSKYGRSLIIEEEELKGRRVETEHYCPNIQGDYKLASFLWGCFGRKINCYEKFAKKLNQKVGNNVFLGNLPN